MKARGAGYTTFESNLDDVSRVTTSLGCVLRAVHEQGSKCVMPVHVRVHAGGVNASNWVTVRRVYGNSVVRVRTSTGRVKTLKLKRVRANTMTMGAAPGVRATKISVVRVRVSHAAESAVRERLVRVLASTQHGGSADLRHMTFKDLENLWGRVRGVADAGGRERARARLCKLTVKQWGVSLRTRPSLHVPLCSDFPKQVVIRAARVMFTALGSNQKPWVARLWRRTKCVRERPARVGDMLTNWRKWCVTEYRPGKPPKCS